MYAYIFAIKQKFVSNLGVDKKILIIQKFTDASNMNNHLISKKVLSIPIIYAFYILNDNFFF